MTEYVPDKAFEQKVQAAFAAPEPRPEFVNQVYADLMQRAGQKRRPARQILGLRPGWAVGLVAAVVMLTSVLFIGPQNVQATFKRLLGYIPGMGIVEQSSQIRVLEEPVTQIREGVAVMVGPAVLTENDTRIEYSVYGVPISAYPGDESNLGCFEQPILRLPDGTEIAADAPVPQDVDTATFMLPCLQGTLPGAAPENWELELRFVPAPPNFTLIPVQEVTPEPVAETSAETPAAEEAPQTPSDGVSTITQMIETEDGYILIGTTESLTPEGTWMGLYLMDLYDADGKQIPTTYPNDIRMPDDSTLTPGGNAWAIQFKGAGVSFPVTVQFKGWVTSSPAPDATASLMVDVGQAPQEGQVWEINQQVDLAGYPVELISMKAFDNAYSFTIDPGEALNTVSVSIEGAESLMAGGGSDGKGTITTSIHYAELPTGQLKIIFSTPVIRREAVLPPIEWQPEIIREFEGGPEVCLSTEALLNAPVLPAEMTGTVIYSLSSPEMQIFKANLDGSQTQAIAINSNRSGLSPDGTKLAYLAEGQLVIRDLTTGEETALPGFSGYSVHWSPDGSQVAFISGNDFNGILLVNIDGGGQKALSNLGNESLAGFSPDGTLLYYAIHGSGGSSFLLRSVVVETGETTDMFLLDDSSAKLPAPAISPDGQSVVYRGANPSMLYRQPLDGSPAELLAEAPTFLSPVWEPSGDWIGISAYTAGYDEGEMYLFSPETCQVYRLPDLTGTLEGITISPESLIP